MRRHKLIFILLVAFLTICTAAHARFGAPEKTVTGKLLLSVDKLRPGDSFEMAVKVTVKKGFHIGSSDKGALYPMKLALTAPKGITFDKPVYPKAKKIKLGTGETVPVYEGDFVVKVKGRVGKSVKPGKAAITAKLDTQACKEDQCYPPEKTTVKLDAAVAPIGAKVKKVNRDVFGAAATPKAAATDAGRVFDRLAEAHPAARFLLLYALGLMLAFTPCVYPMVPVTVGYFSTQDEKHTGRIVLLAATYVLGIALTYSILGAIAATTGGFIGSAMQNPFVLIGVAAVLVALALSMFGLYELRPPAFVAKRASGRRGVAGALFMGLVFGIVAAPCVGPVVLGLLLFVAQLKSPLMGFAMFFTLALGLGTPLFFLATFSAKLPVPGMWMVTVERIAGFLLLGAAAYFILPLVPDDIGRLLIPGVIIAAGIYLALFEKSLRSGRLAASFGKAFGAAALAAAVLMLLPNTKAIAVKWEPYAAASVAQSAQFGRPVMIDYGAEWCGACKELEHKTFTDPAVAAAAERFDKFRVDGTDSADPAVLAAMSRYRVKGYPTVIFIDSEGNEVEAVRVEGFIGPKDMLERMKAVK